MMYEYNGGVFAIYREAGEYLTHACTGSKKMIENNGSCIEQASGIVFSKIE